MAVTPKVGVIVLNFNGKSCLSACLDSLSRLEYPHFEGIIVDNDSSDDSLAAAEAMFPQFTFVRNTRNEGFAKGMNIGMRLAFLRSAEWCWLINNDTEIDAQALMRLMTVAKEAPRAGLLSPLIYEKDGARLWFAKGRVDFFRMRAVHFEPTRNELDSDSYSSEFLTGCALLVKKELVDAIGFLDERFFLYYEDVDYSLRATRAGFACLVVSGAQVRHSEESRLRPRKAFFLVYSGLLFFEKYASFFMRLYLSVYVTMRRVKNFLDLRRKRDPVALEVARAYKRYFHER